MNKIVKTFAFVIVLAGLLAFGAATMAKAPTAVADQHVKQLHGQVLDNGVPVDPHQIQARK